VQEFVTTRQGYRLLQQGRPKSRAAIPTSREFIPRAGFDEPTSESCRPTLVPAIIGIRKSLRDP
jgi:hypothetical protein